MTTRIVVLGASFAGLTGAIELKNKLHNEASVTCIAKTDEFLFMPSLIWVPFGLRDKSQITFAVRPVLESKGVAFIQSDVTDVDLKTKQVKTDDGNVVPYDYLLIATGPRMDYSAIEGFTPGQGNLHSIFSLPDALETADGFNRLLANPGPVVIGAVQGASCFGAAYEFLFNMAYQLKRHGVLEKCPLTFLTAEPYPAHLGMGGFGGARQMTEFMFKQLNVKIELNALVSKITPYTIMLEDGREILYSFAMLAPAYKGVPVISRLSEIVDTNGFVKTTPYYNTEAYPEVFAAGIAVSLPAPEKTPVPCGVPKTGYLSEEMAKTAAANIVASIEGKPMSARPPAEIDAKCVMDAGNSGIIMSSDHFLEPREHVWLIPGPEAHWAKLAFEKYFLTTRKLGVV